MACASRVSARREMRPLVKLSECSLDADRLKRFRDLGAAGVNTGLMSEPRDQILPVLDKWAELKRQVAA